MKRMIILTLAVLMLMLAVVPSQAYGSALSQDELKRILHEPNVAKAGGLPSLLTATVGPERARATLQNLYNPNYFEGFTNTTYYPNSILYNNSWWSYNYTGNYNFGSTIYSSLTEALNAVRSYYSTYQVFPAVFFYYDSSVYSRGQWSGSSNRYNLEYYDGSSWHANGTTTP